MRIVFMGTPGFAAVSLRRLYEDGHDILAVFTQPDKPQGRGMKLACCPVKELALAHGTPVLQPTTLRDGETLYLLHALRPDVIAVVAYGRLLPEEILRLPPYGCINIHGSILPKYRGAAPIQRAVLNGETETGVTSMYMAPEMDAGDIIMIKKTPIGDDETSGELFERLSVLGAELLSETVAALENGTAARTKQNDGEATFAPPLTKELAPLDWTKRAREITAQVRGLNPWPVATACIGGAAFKVFKARGRECPSGKAPGTVISAEADGIEIACADGTVTILELQAPGGKRMAAADYLRGHPICP
ncbi:methionyl-tRNA formyltransferase [Sporobacter termitidis DSM 10068]|uniref:Methionyl-tRNA formyltransferase n=1 Tax=Sporobacter termitidis DSM 10068 TaxID=1123282 RepID=A0A1M5THP0_9FIRM|nr:methionyl-tRNA formyltransferase [Sporobacter termitidis]SHH50181.1 methionyl-tRNA formyltransferase [Sporobacter termitidis DSM 10068]